MIHYQHKQTLNYSRMTKIKPIYALLSAHPYKNEIMLRVLILKASGAGTAVCTH
jgi:hypothetical protein